MKITILGAGSFATSIAQILCDNHHDVLMWSVEDDVNLKINNEKINPKYGYENKIGENVFATNDIKKALDFSTIILNVIPTQYIRQTFEKINLNISQESLFVNFSKGIEPKTLLFIKDIIFETVDSKFIKNFVNVSGPSHAELLAKRSLTALSVASNNKDDAIFISSLIKNDYIKTQISDDVFGLEFISSSKNVIALGAGMLEGLGYGENIISAFISQGFKELLEISKHLNISLDTMISYGGLGDLIVTATSKNSRNVKFGRYLGQGKTLIEAQELTKQVAEGVRSLESLNELVTKYKINSQIIVKMDQIIYHNQDVNLLLEVFEEN